MPNIGEIGRGGELGYGGDPRAKFIWAACPDCGKERWVQFWHNKPRSRRCYSCAGKQRLGEKNVGWKGGRYRDKCGYINVRLPSEDFFSPMAQRGGYVLEHRLIIAKHLNRCLLSWEVVHHKNGIKDDNRLENLQLLPTQKFHIVDSHIKAQLSRLEIKVEEQAKQIRLLKWRIKELERANSKIV